MKAGDVVLYFEHGREFLALAFFAHSIPGHEGENGEPLLHLLIVDDNPPRPGIDPATPFAGKPEQKVRYIFDVAHSSADKGEAGRWREIPAAPRAEEAMQAMREENEKLKAALAAVPQADGDSSEGEDSAADSN